MKLAAYSEWLLIEGGRNSMQVRLYKYIKFCNRQVIVSKDALNFYINQSHASLLQMPDKFEPSYILSTINPKFRVVFHVRCPWSLSGLWFYFFCRVKIIRPTPTFSFSKRRRKATAGFVYQGQGVGVINFFKQKLIWSIAAYYFLK